MEEVYEYFENLGNIFDIEEKSDDLIKEMKEKISSIQEKTASIEDKKSVLYIILEKIKHTHREKVYKIT